MRTYIILVAALVTGAIYFTANAKPKESRIKVTVKEAPGPDYVDDEKLFLGAFDSGAGTTLLQFKLCGAMVVMEVPNDMTSDKDVAEFESIVTRLITQYCGNK